MVDTNSSQSSKPSNIRERNPLVSGLLGAIATGLGHLYSGRPGQAAIWLVASLMVYAAIATAVVLTEWSPLLLVFWALLSGIVWLASVASAVIVARNAEAEYRLRNFNRWWVYGGWILLVAGTTEIAGQLLESNVVKAYEFPSHSMIPTILAGDHLLADRTSGHRKAVDRGNIVVFRFPNDSASSYLADRPPSMQLCIDSKSLKAERSTVKRIVGLPGEEIEFRDGRIIIDGVAAKVADVDEEDLVVAGPTGSVRREELPGTQDGHLISTSRTSLDFGPYEIPPNHVFVVGDNRGQSSDSRCWGPLPVANIEGTIEQIWWSEDASGIRWDRIGEKVE